MSFTLILLLMVQIPTPYQRKLLRDSKAKFYKAFSSISYEDTLHDFDVVHYEIHVDLDFNQESIDAYNVVTFTSKVDNLSSIFLHLIGLTVDSISGAASFARNDSILTINLATPLNTGDTGMVSIFYHGNPQSGGGVFGGGLRFAYGNHLAFVDDEPYGAKRWVPIYDLPTDKALVDQYIKVPMGYTVVANGELVDSTIVGGNIIFHWRENYPIANYLIVFAASDYYAVIEDSAYINGEYLPVRHWLPASDTAWLRNKFVRTPQMLEFLSDIYGTYPYLGEKYAHASVPIGGAMENQTNTFINTNAGWGSSWDWVIVHEMGHQWWGDWVTLGTWADIWLNEGFATYTEALWWEHRYGNSGLRAYMTRIFETYLNGEPNPPYPVYDPDYMWGVVVYEKGASVLHMLRYIVGDSIFFRILREYGQRFAYGNAVTSEFIEVVDSVSGQDLGWFFDEWVFAPGHPVYEYSYTSYPVSGDTFRMDITVNQVQSHAHGVPTYKMPLEFKIVTDLGVEYVTLWDSLDTQTFTVYVNGRPRSLLLDPNQWILEEHTFTGIGESSAVENQMTTVVKDFLYIGNFSVPVDVKIYDPAGRSVKNVKLHPGAARVRISDLRPGVYYAVFKDKRIGFIKY